MDLCEQLFEVVIEQRLEVGQASERSVIAHGSQSFFPAHCDQDQDQHFIILRSSRILADLLGGEHGHEQHGERLESVAEQTEERLDVGRRLEGVDLHVIRIDAGRPAVFQNVVQRHHLAQPIGIGQPG